MDGTEMGWSETIEEGKGDYWDVGNQMEILVYDGKFCLTIENPWSGDSESGFGAETSFRFTRETAERLLKNLTRWLESPLPCTSPESPSAPTPPSSQS